MFKDICKWDLLPLMGQIRSRNAYIHETDLFLVDNGKDSSGDLKADNGNEQTNKLCMERKNIILFESIKQLT